jgi:hypothetical protein
MAALMTLTLGCEEPIEYTNLDYSIAENQYLGYATTQTIKVHPEGAEVSVFGGAVILNFPEGSVSQPEVFIIGMLSTDHLDVEGINIYETGFYLEAGSPYQELNEVTIQVKYDLDPECWRMNPPEAEQDLSLNFVYPDFEGYQGMHPLGDCSVDSESKMIKSCIYNCGYFLVSEN